MICRFCLGLFPPYRIWCKFCSVPSPQCRFSGEGSGIFFGLIFFYQWCQWHPVRDALLTLTSQIANLKRSLPNPNKVDFANHKNILDPYIFTNLNIVISLTTILCISLTSKPKSISPKELCDEISLQQQNVPWYIYISHIYIYISGHKKIASKTPGFGVLVPARSDEGRLEQRMHGLFGKSCA